MCEGGGRTLGYKYIIIFFLSFFSPFFLLVQVREEKLFESVKGVAIMLVTGQFQGRNTFVFK